MSSLDNFCDFQKKMKLGALTENFQKKKKKTRLQPNN